MLKNKMNSKSMLIDKICSKSILIHKCCLKLMLINKYYLKSMLIETLNYVNIFARRLILSNKLNDIFCRKLVLKKLFSINRIFLYLLANYEFDKFDIFNN